MRVPCGDAIIKRDESSHPRLGLHIKQSSAQLNKFQPDSATCLWVIPLSHPSGRHAAAAQNYCDATTVTQSDNRCAPPV
jgi:hypothetical protein